MSKNLNLHIEIKINGTWHHYSNPSFKQDYNVMSKLIDDSYFEHIVNDNADFTSIGGSNDVPNNLTFLTKKSIEFSLEEGNITVLNSEQIKGFVNWIMNKTNENFIYYSDFLFTVFNDICYPVKKDNGDYEYEVEDMRYIIWLY